jgi:hypothetical protein
MNHGSNDLKVDATPEVNKILCEACNCYDDECSQCKGEHTITDSGTKYIAEDTQLMSYFMKRCHQVASGHSTPSAECNEEFVFVDRLMEYVGLLKSACNKTEVPEPQPQQSLANHRVNGYNLYTLHLRDRLGIDEFRSIGLIKVATMWKSETDDVKAKFNAEAALLRHPHN